MNYTEQNTHINRISYFDALRGLSMILVVLSHVFLFMSPSQWDVSPVAAILMSFRMPLFFFVSGFFAFKAIDKWTKEIVTDIMIRKFRAQIICPIVFFILYQITQHLYPFAFIDYGFGWFWFTIALFQMFTVYVLLNLLSRVLKKNLVDIALVLIIIASAIGGECSPVIGPLAWHQLAVYFQFFAFGILARKYWNLFERLLECDWFTSVMVIVFVSGCFWFYRDQFYNPESPWRHITQGVVHRYSGLVSVLVFFHARKAYWDTDAPVARFLRFTGRRTLDIYMMHIFLVPHLGHYAWLQTIAPANMVVLKLGIAVPLALAIVCMCLLFSQLLRCSHTLAVWLFGVRNRPVNVRIERHSN